MQGPTNKTYDIFAVVHEVHPGVSPRKLTLVDDTSQPVDIYIYSNVGAVAIRDTLAIKYAKKMNKDGEWALLALSTAIIRVNTPHHPDRTAALLAFYDAAMASTGAAGGSASS